MTPTRFLLTTLALSVAMLPVVAFAVEVPGEIVHVEPIQASIQVEEAPRVDHSAAWESYLREQRQVRVAHLQAYADAGTFPQGDSPGWSHQFLDAVGTPCAVASLIMTSGRADLVVNQSQVNNAVVVSELKDGPIVDWVLTSGLTMEEISVIQEPGFMDEEIVFEQPMEEPPRVVTRAERKEQARIRRHLAATLDLIDADTESSIWKAMTRLGDKRFEAPPTAGVGALAVLQ